MASSEGAPKTGLFETLMLAQAVVLEPNRTLDLLNKIGDGKWKVPPALRKDWAPILSRWIEFLDAAQNGASSESGLLDQVSYSLVWRSNSARLELDTVRDVRQFIRSARVALVALTNESKRRGPKKQDRGNVLALVESIAERKFNSYSGLR